MPGLLISMAMMVRRAREEFPGPSSPLERDSGSIMRWVDDCVFIVQISIYQVFDRGAQGNLPPRLADAVLSVLSGG